MKASWRWGGTTTWGILKVSLPSRLRELPKDRRSAGNVWTVMCSESRQPKGRTSPVPFPWPWGPWTPPVLPSRTNCPPTLNCCWFCSIWLISSNKDVRFYAQHWIKAIELICEFPWCLALCHWPLVLMQPGGCWRLRTLYLRPSTSFFLQVYFDVKINDETNQLGFLVIQIQPLKKIEWNTSYSPLWLFWVFPFCKSSTIA